MNESAHCALLTSVTCSLLTRYHRLSSASVYQLRIAVYTLGYEPVTPEECHWLNYR